MMLIFTPGWVRVEKSLYALHGFANFGHESEPVAQDESPITECDWDKRDISLIQLVWIDAKQFLAGGVDRVSLPERLIYRHVHAGIVI